jgi:hypothetical protein
MKQQFTKSLRVFTKDRYITVLLASFLLLCIAIIIFLAVQIHPSELQVVVHYTSFGSTNFYRDKWYYLLTFVVFVLLVAVTHSVISYKLLQKRDREITAAFLWLSIILILIATALFYQVLKIASLS